MNARKMGVVAASLMGLGLTLGLNSGCAGCLQPPPPPEAVLAGTWLMTPVPQTVPPVENWRLTFDSDGNLTNITFTIVGVTTTWTNPSGATSVDGDSVYISSTDQGSGLTFTGTLNSDKNVIDGSLTSNIVVGGVTISLSQGPATMTKQ